MKRDAPQNIASDIGLAIVNEKSEEGNEEWNVYLLNFKEQPLDTVLISTKGAGFIERHAIERQPKRHSIPEVPAQGFVKIESIPFSFLNFTNEYWVSYFEGQALYEKKYIFLPESVVTDNFTQVPFINKQGIMLK